MTEQRAKEGAELLQKILELRRVKNENLNNFCIGTYFEDYRSFCIEDSRKEFKEIEDSCKELFIDLITQKIVHLKMKLENL